MTVLVFGGVFPVMAPVLLGSLARGTIGFVVPAQTFFGPAAFAV